MLYDDSNTNYRLAGQKGNKMSSLTTREKLSVIQTLAAGILSHPENSDVILLSLLLAPNESSESLELLDEWFDGAIEEAAGEEEGAGVLTDEKLWIIVRATAKAISEGPFPAEFSSLLIASTPYEELSDEFRARFVSNLEELSKLV